MKYFSTNRLTAETLQEAHLQDLVDLHLDPEVSRYLGGVRSPAATKAYLQNNVAHWDRYGFGLWVLRTKTGEFAGRAGIRRVHLEDVEEVEIAYTFKRALWSQGLASEITEALTSIGLRQLKLPSLVGLVSIENGASCRVLEKSGFARERTAIYHGDEVIVFRSPVEGRVGKTVGALFVRKPDEALLGLRAVWKSSWPLHWDTIGGHVEEVESLDDALVREVQEEIGVLPTKFSLLAVIKEQRPDIYGDALHHVYGVTSWRGGEPSNVSNEHTELKWFSVNEMRLLTNIVDSDYPRFALQALSGDRSQTD